jgi:hypothetical protein
MFVDKSVDFLTLEMGTERNKDVWSSTVYVSGFVLELVRVMTVRIRTAMKH